MANDKRDEQGLPFERTLGDFDPAKRETLRKLVTAAAFAVPVVTTFSIDGLLISSVRAAKCPNGADPNECPGPWPKPAFLPNQLTFS